MACTCRDAINAQLAEFNTRVRNYYTITDSGLGLPWPIETEQIERGRGKKKAMGLFASFCPFCGVALKGGGTACP